MYKKIWHQLRHSMSVLTGCVLASSQASSSELTDIVEQIDGIRDKHGMASAYVLMVDKDDVLVHQGLGIRAWDDERPVTDQDYYRLGSISKAFTGLALLKAEEQGCLKLTDPVRKLAPDALYTNAWNDTHPMTLAMLMEHTSGWHDMSWFEFKYNTPESLTDALALRPESRVSVWPPGVHSEYSNSGPGFAGWVLEQACDVDFDRYIEKTIFSPLDMPSATLNRTEAVARDLVGGYNTDPKEPIRYWNFIFRPAGAMNVRPIEMTQFLQLLLNRGQHNGKALFTPEQIARMETPTTTLAAKSGLSFGYGLGIYAETQNGHVIYGHGGDADGYLTRFSYSKESGRAFFVVITMFDHKPLREMRQVLETWLVKDLPKIEPPRRYRLSAEQKNMLEGDYKRASVRFPQAGWERQTLTVSQRDGRLGYQQGKGRWRELIPVSGKLFRRRGEPEATISIVNEKGKWYFQGVADNWVK